MNQYLDTIQPELMNITRLFGIPDSEWEAPRYTYSAWADAGRYHCRFTDGTHTAPGGGRTAADAAPQAGGPAACPADAV